MEDAKKDTAGHVPSPPLVQNSHLPGLAGLVGSSQGACATLNCALECPKLMHTIAVCHPVGHAPHRYVAITQPSLLIFDTEDAGHPVSVGRQMRRQLPNPRDLVKICEGGDLM